jgi:hypothetical protein
VRVQVPPSAPNQTLSVGLLPIITVGQARRVLSRAVLVDEHYSRRHGYAGFVQKRVNHDWLNDALNTEQK